MSTTSSEVQTQLISLPVQCSHCSIVLTSLSDLRDHFFPCLEKCSMCTYSNQCRASMALHLHRHLTGQPITLLQYELTIRSSYKSLHLDPVRFEGQCNTCGATFAGTFVSFLVHLLDGRRHVGQMTTRDRSNQSDNEYSSSNTSPAVNLITGMEQLPVIAQPNEPIAFECEQFKFVVRWSNGHLTEMTEQRFALLSGRIRRQWTDYFTANTFTVKIYAEQASDQQSMQRVL